MQTERIACGHCESTFEIRFAVRPSGITCPHCKKLVQLTLSREVSTKQNDGPNTTAWAVAQTHGLRALSSRREDPHAGRSGNWVVWILAAALAGFYLYLFSLRFPWGDADSFASPSVSTGIVTAWLFALIHANVLSRSRTAPSSSTARLFLTALPYAISVTLAVIALVAVYRWEIHRMWHDKLARLAIYFYLSALTFSICTIRLRRLEAAHRKSEGGEWQPLLTGSLYLATCLIACVIVNNIVLIYADIPWWSERNVFLFASVLACVVVAVLGVRRIRRQVGDSVRSVPTTRHWLDIAVMYLLASLMMTGIGVGMMEFIRAPRTSTSSMTVTARYNWGEVTHAPETSIRSIPIGERLSNTVFEEAKVMPVGVALGVLAILVVWFLRQRKLGLPCLGVTGVSLVIALVFYGSYHSYPTPKDVSQGEVAIPSDDKSLARNGALACRCAPTLADRFLLAVGLKSRDQLNHELARYVAERVIRTRLPGEWSIYDAQFRRFRPLRTALRDVSAQRQKASDSVERIGPGLTAVYGLRTESAGGRDATTRDYIVALAEQSPFVWRCEQIVTRHDQLRRAEAEPIKK